MRVFHGTIITCDQSDQVFQYLVEDGGKIQHVGDELPEACRGAELVELDGRALLPAFGDGHLHFSNWALVAGAFFDTRDATDFAHLGAMVQEFAASHPKDKILVAFGTSKHSIAEKRLITREELDAFYSERPVYIICYDGHSAIANSKMLALFPDKVRAQRGFDADSGHLINEAYYAGTDFASASIPPLTLVRCIVEGYDRLAAYGVGLIHAAEGIGFPRDLDVDMVRMVARARARRDAFQTRLFFQTMEVSKALKRKLPRIGGCFATALDGCFGVCDAALKEPYSNDPSNRGILFFSDEVVHAFVKEAHRAGLQIALHVIGDAAVEQALGALEAAQQDQPRQDHRHILIHACLLSPENLERCAALGVGLTMEPGFLSSPLEPISYLEEILGERAHASSPMRQVIARGVHLSGGSDAPVSHPDPIDGIHGACNHPYDPAQSVTIQQALKMYTSEVAWASFDDDQRGTLEAGKIADMVVLSQNPLAMPPKELRSLKVEQLYLDGRPFRRGMGVASALYKGFVGRPVVV